MAAVDVIVDNLVTLWRIPSIRQNFHWIFLLISVVGSVLKELELVPQTYFSSTRNALNVYFVKVSWGWTLLLLTPFLLLSTPPSAGASPSSAAGCCLSPWQQPCGTPSPRPSSTSRTPPLQAGRLPLGRLRHIGTLLHPGLLRSLHRGGNGAHGLPEDRQALHSPQGGPHLLYVALNLIVIVWVWMFACTSVYFHDPSHKLLGTICGLIAWYLTYRVWYLKPFSPGLPPQRHPKERKQHA
ncbi:hypothetical protein KUCAC02_011845 [Chaenocephalus aceratus]|uniref:Uncharacterized protein n=1 Tax=Chaenocephalus aceratus TaxID=36190 RepID=A0ACB9XAK7_CHAAC|nr:hypothetical protein KUCAC02_011845 [Chaenocephalus aceratus]